MTTANVTRVTTPYLTKYERARILGTRALQIRFVPLFPPIRTYQDVLPELIRFDHSLDRNLTRSIGYGLGSV